MNGCFLKVGSAYRNLTTIPYMGYIRTKGFWLCEEGGFSCKASILKLLSCSYWIVLADRDDDHVSRRLAGFGKFASRLNTNFKC